MKNILLATDLTSNSDRAMARTIQLTRETGAAMHVLHIVPPYPLKKAKQLAHALKEELQTLIHKQMEAHRDGKNVKVHVNVVQAANTFNEILAHAYRIKADLIVLGMHGKTKLRYYFTGTTMERVIRAGLKPVLVVKDVPSGSYEKVVSGVDYSPGSYTAFRTAQELAPKANFYAIHAYDIPPYPKKSHGYMLSKALLEEKHQKKIDRFVKDEIAYLKKIRKHEYKIIGKLEPGNPYKVLTRKVKNLKADLLAIGSNGDIGYVLPGTKLGGTAMEILLDPPCDVLVSNNWKEMSQILI